MSHHAFLPILGLIGFGLASCGGGSSSTAETPAGRAFLRGSVTYRERMALPPDAVIKVRLSDVSLMDAPATDLAETTFTAGGRQVPFPFRLSYDPALIKPQNSYAVRATIHIGATLTFTTDTSYPVITRGNPEEVDVLLVRLRTPAPAAGAAPRLSLEKFRAVDGKTVRGDNTATWTAYFDGEELRHIKESSSAGDLGSARVEYWFENGRLTSYSSSADRTLTDPAKEPGRERVVIDLSFNAAGEAGRKAKTVNGKAAEVDAAEITGARARADLLAKEAKKAAVQSTALIGTAWRLEDLLGRGVLDGAEATLEFPEGGKVAGKASCNRFFGSVTVSVQSIRFSKFGSTMMACPEAIMKQERQYLQALEAAERYEIKGTVMKIYCKGADRPLSFVKKEG